MNPITFLEYVGLCAFSISGVYTAIGRKLDLFGIYIVALVTSVGGGVMRDIITNSGIPVFFTDYTMLPCIFIPATLVIILRRQFRYQTFFTAIDALGLAAFTTSAGLKAIQNNYNFLLFLFVASITGVGGGILRDILVNVKPAIFRHDIYATSGMIGAISLWFLYPLAGTASAYICMLLIVGIRMFGYLKKVNLPVIQLSPKPTPPNSHSWFLLFLFEANPSA